MVRESFPSLRSPASEAARGLRNLAPGPLIRKDMHERLLLAASQLSTDALFERIKALALQERGATVELVAHLAELLGRRTDLGEGWGPVYEHCRAHLRLSEDAAYNRVAAARAVRRFPVILDHLAAGWVNVTTVKVLAPVLTDENHAALLKEARHRRRSEVEIIVARMAPRTDTPGRLRKLPARRPLAPMSVSAPSPQEDSAATDADAGGAGSAEPESPVDETRPKQGSSSPEDEAPTATPGPVLRPTTYRPPVKPVAPARFRVDVTVGQEGHDALRFLQDMLAREIPAGDVSKVVEHCLIATAGEVRKKMMAATNAPRRARPSQAGSRGIAARVRRAVWKRDGGRCAFVGRHGRCTQTRYLELHHIHPHGLGGPATVENLALRCRAHNVYESERDFGVRPTAARPARGEKPRVCGQIAPSQDGGARAVGPDAS